MKSKKLSKLLKIQAVVFAVIIAAGACSVGAFAYNCSRVRSDVLRMHVIANSDSDEDQALKLKVRDAVLERGAELFDGTVTADIVYTFTGTYTKDGDTVVLMFTTAGTASENWGSLAGSYFQNTENAAFADSDYAAGVVQCKEAESHLIADLFEGPYLLDNLTTSDAAFDAEECTVTITISGDTFDYVITNSDDD